MVPFELEGWSNSVALNEIDEDLLIEEINVAYKKIHTAILTKDIQNLKLWYEDFMQIRSTAFYFTPERKVSDWDDFVDMIKRENLELLPLPDQAFLHFYGFGKLVSLLDKDGNSIIRFINKENIKHGVNMEFKFHKKELSSELSII